jgi:hypothetical protein
MNDDLSRFLCHNPQCPDFDKRDANNLSVGDRYGPDKERRMLYCSSCKARFSERRGLFLSLHLSSGRKLSEPASELHTVHCRLTKGGTP